MNISFICPRIPYPPNRGDKIRSYNIIKYLASKHNIFLFSLIEKEEEKKHKETLETFINYVYTDSIHPTYKKIYSFFSLFQKFPISVRYFYSNKIQNALDDVIRNYYIDIIFCFCSTTAEYIFRSQYRHQLKKKALWIMDLVDVDSEKWLDYSKCKKLPLSLIYSFEAKFLSKYEKKILDDFDNILIISEQERKILSNKYKSNKIFVMPNGVDLDFFIEDYHSHLKKTGPTIVFTGVMNYWPNIDGVTWFVKKILPPIKEKYPNITLYIVGSNPPPIVKALSAIKGVQVTGYVKDVRDYISIADISIVPLRIARGLQNKVLEAMAMGKAVVTTSVALDGINARPNRDIVVADNPDVFSKKILDILNSPSLGKEIGRNARQFIERHFSWESKFSILDKIITNTGSKFK